MKLKYEVNDPCWLYIPVEGDDGEYTEKRVQGTVKFWFELPDYPARLHLIQVGDPEWPHYETRDAFFMADSEDGLSPYECGKPVTIPTEKKPADGWTL